MTSQGQAAAQLGPSDGLSDAELRARRLSMQFSASRAREILAHAIKTEFPGRVALVSSFGAESAALLHLVAQIDAATPVIFLETGKHFAQTLSYRRKLARLFGLTNVRDATPDQQALAERDVEGELWKHDPDACCTLRKVAPLKEALGDFDAWITGRKQFHGAGRINLPAFEASGDHIKVNPLIRWTPDRIADYAREHSLPPHPLVEQGFPSIGCWPCTHPASDHDVRAGRWRGAAKTECGIHTQPI